VLTGGVFLPLALSAIVVSAVVPAAEVEPGGAVEAEEVFLVAPEDPAEGVAAAGEAHALAVAGYARDQRTLALLDLDGAGGRGKSQQQPENRERAS
jgi:hypothetical protein